MFGVDWIRMEGCCRQCLLGPTHSNAPSLLELENPKLRQHHPPESNMPCTMDSSKISPFSINYQTMGGLG